MNRWPKNNHVAVPSSVQRAKDPTGFLVDIVEKSTVKNITTNMKVGGQTKNPETLWAWMLFEQTIYSERRISRQKIPHQKLENVTPVHDYNFSRTYAFFGVYLCVYEKENLEWKYIMQYFHTWTRVSENSNKLLSCVKIRSTGWTKRQKRKQQSNQYDYFTSRRQSLRFYLSVRDIVAVSKNQIWWYFCSRWLRVNVKHQVWYG